MLLTPAVHQELLTFFCSDQPETCRRCGARTDFDETESGLQLHNCHCCGNRYFVTLEE